MRQIPSCRGAEGARQPSLWHRITCVVRHHLEEGRTAPTSSIHLSFHTIRQHCRPHGLVLRTCFKKKDTIQELILRLIIGAVHTEPMKGINMNLKSYPTDLTDAQWENLLPYLPKPSPVGRPLKWEMRSIINAMFYIVKSGCQWRMLPHQMPPWQTVYSHFRKWKIDGTWFMIHQALHNQTRRDVGKVPSPTVAIIDSQSVKTVGT